MEGLRKIVALLVLVLMMMIKVSNGQIHYVGGGKYHWTPNINFTEWSGHERFYVGDWLYFGFDKNLYSVLEVNRTSYEECIETDFIKNITKGGRDVFELKEAKQYYFISGRGYCYQRMKVELNVEDIPPPAPVPAKSGSSSNLGSQFALPAVLAIALVWTVLFTSY